MLAITIEPGRVRVGERFSVSFQRTLRIPEDGGIYPLPPGLGAFPLHRVADHRAAAPETWHTHDGVFIPMYQREALWLGFDAAPWKPNAVTIAVGRVNVLSGDLWDGELRANPQNYIVCPDQPWLDGINLGDGIVRQFVAMPLGMGYTVEAQVAGAEELGGIQIRVYEPKAGLFPDQAPEKPPPPAGMMLGPAAASKREMGLGAGGKIRQKVYPDPYDLEAWDRENYGDLFVYIVNSEQYRAMTGREPPPTPISAKTYTDYGLPWFDLYDEAKGSVSASATLQQIKTIREQDIERGRTGESQDEPVEIVPSKIKRLKHGKPSSDEET